MHAYVKGGSTLAAVKLAYREQQNSLTATKKQKRRGERMNACMQCMSGVGGAEAPRRAKNWKDKEIGNFREGASEVLRVTNMTIIDGNDALDTGDMQKSY